MLTTHQIKSAAALALALGAIGAPAASAHVAPADPPQGSQSSTGVSSVVRVIAPNSGFDWGDAGIGAASGFALSDARPRRRTHRLAAPRPPLRPIDSADQLTTRKHLHGQAAHKFNGT